MDTGGVRLVYHFQTAKRFQLRVYAVGGRNRF